MPTPDASRLWITALSDDVGPLSDLLIWLCALIGITAVVFSGQLFVKLKRMRWLATGARSATGFGKLTVIIPARNEETCLGSCVHSILDQGEIDLEVVVVNDHSTDRTGEIADVLAAQDRRVRVIHDPPVEPGWLGKPNAMQKALETASSEYILFSDADIVHSPGCIAAGWSEARRRKLGLVSFLPSFEFQGLWEHILLPGYVAWMGMFLSRAVEDPASKAAAAAGAFLLVRADALETAGGLETVRNEMVDDVAVACRFKERGLPVGFYLAPELLRVRLFKSGVEAFWGMTKNILGACPGGVFGALALVPLGIISYSVPPIAFGLALMTGNVWLLGASVLAYGSQYAGIMIFRRIFVFHPLRLLFFPLSSIPTVCCMGRALYHRWVHGAVLWRGRRLRIRE